MAKRLRPLTDTKPKCLLEVGGRTLLERTVRAMQQAGISEFVVVTGYRANQIVDFLTPLAHRNGDGGEVSFHFLHNADYEHNNNIYSLWMAGEYVRGKEFLLMDSDILCDPAAVVRIAQERRTHRRILRAMLRKADTTRAYVQSGGHYGLFLVRTGHSGRLRKGTAAHAEGTGVNEKRNQPTSG